MMSEPAPEPDCWVDYSQWPGPPYSPIVWRGGFPHGNQGRPYDLYHSVNGKWYRYERDPFGRYDWVKIESEPEEASW